MALKAAVIAAGGTFVAKDGWHMCAGGAGCGCGWCCGHEMVWESKIIQVSSELYTNYLWCNTFLTFISPYRLTRDVYSSSKGLEELDVTADGVLDGATKWSEVRTFCRWVKNIKQNMVLNTISHPRIAAHRRHWCIKEIRWIRNGGSVMWQMQLTVLWGHRDLTRSRTMMVSDKYVY